MVRKSTTLPHLRAASEAARELTKLASHDAQSVAHIATGMREMFAAYRDTANADLPHDIRITRLDVDLEYGVNPQDLATTIERNDNIVPKARELANGILHISINGAPPLAINLSFFLSPNDKHDGHVLMLMAGNRREDGIDPDFFLLEVVEKNPSSFAAIDKVQGIRPTGRVDDDTPMSFMDFIGFKIQDLMVHKRNPKLAADGPPR